MRKNLLKKMGILGLTSLALIAPTMTKADTESDKICTTHKNYYLFVQIHNADEYITSVYESDGGIKYNYNSAAFPMLPENAKPTDGNTGFARGRICLSKNGKSDGTNQQCQYGTWTIEDYLRVGAEVEANSGNKKTIKFTYDGKERESHVYEKKLKDENGNRVVEHYVGRGAWYTCTESTCTNATEGVGADSFYSKTIQQLSKGVYLPTQTIIDFDPSYSNTAKIERKQNIKNDFLDYIMYEDNGNPKTDSNNNLVFNPNPTQLVPFSHIWHEGNAASKSILVPAVYYVEYQTCEDAYTGTINYYYYKDGKDVDEKVDFGNSHDNPYVVKLAAGESEKVSSPDVKGCTIVDKNGKKADADKEVTLSISATNPQNVSKDVYYYCKTNEEPKSNANTGDALIYLAWAVGLGAIGYSVYYFKKVKKEEV